MSRPSSGSLAWWKQRFGFAEGAVWEAFVADFRHWQYVNLQSPYASSSWMLSDEPRFWTWRVPKHDKQLSTLSLSGVTC